MVEPFYSDANTALYCGDSRVVVPELRLTADLVLADPPYEQTAQGWDRWPDGWPSDLIAAARSMWCFGTMRMFLTRWHEFRHWKFSHDIVWRKGAGTGIRSDRFLASHELAVHLYRGTWDTIHHQVPRETVTPSRTTAVHRVGHPTGVYADKTPTTGTWADDGTRLALSVREARNMRGRGLHPNEKPVRLLEPLLAYACPPGGLVLDPFAGSGATAEAARLTGRRAILVEADERWCEVIANRLSQPVIELTT